MFGPFLEYVLGNFGEHLLLLKMDPKSELFDGLLEAVWSHLGRLLGCLGALLGGPVFQTHCKNESKCMLLIVCYRYLSFPGPLSGAILVSVGPFWALEWGPKFLRHWSKQLVSFL